MGFKTVWSGFKTVRQAIRQMKGDLRVFEWDLDSWSEIESKIDSLIKED